MACRGKLRLRRALRLAPWLLAIAPGAGCVHVIGEHELLLGGRAVVEGGGSASVLEVPAAGGVMLRGFVFAHPGSRFVLIYFGGNAEWITPDTRVGRLGGQHGFDAYAVNYRGYGSSDGTSSLDAIQEDSLHVYDAVAARPEVTGRPIVVYGLSLGAMAALHVASHRAVDGVVLQGPPTDAAANVARLRRTLPWYVRPFVRLRAAPEIAARRPQPIDLARAIRAPLLVLHGTRDRIVAPEFGRAVFEAAPSEDKSFCAVPGANHNDLWQVGGATAHDCLQRFLERLSPAGG
jgi:hypothetical protein